MTRKKSQAQLKKELDKLVSLYVRRKACKGGKSANCYTCGRRLALQGLHAGHFVSRVHLATRFDLRNIRVQCPGCNIFGGGQTAIFAERLSQEYGEGIIAELYREARKIIKNYPYESEIERYKELLKNL